MSLTKAQKVMILRVHDQTLQSDMSTEEFMEYERTAESNWYSMPEEELDQNLETVLNKWLGELD